ncbi:MAG: helix-turn-helix transcriptional regulator [Planctomycetota bacterium]
MANRKVKIKHGEIVRLFAARLREVRNSRGMTQAELARQAQVTTSYIGRLESAGAAPGIDLVERLAEALGTTAHDLLPTVREADPLPMMQTQARKLFETLLGMADQETLQMVNPLLARLIESPTRRR